MREQLAKLAGHRLTFTATYIKSGQRLRNRWQILPTLLFWDVRDSTGNQVADHLWITQFHPFIPLNLQPGTWCAFQPLSSPTPKVTLASAPT